MEDFQKDLAAILEKYPTLPKFTLTIQPRFTISTEEVKPQYVPPTQENRPKIVGTAMVNMAQSEPLGTGEFVLPSMPNLSQIMAAENAKLV